VKTLDEEPHLLLEVLELSDVNSLLQVIEKHKDLDGVYLGGYVEGVDERFMKLISGLSALRTQASVVFKVKDRDVLEGLDRVAEKITNVEFVAVLSDLSILGSVKLEKLNVGFEVLNPYPNISKLRELGVKYLVIPMALLRSRIAKEAEARNVRIITTNVNSPENYIKSRSFKVYAVVSEKPSIKREAESLGI
jgi:hypothetical protein